MSGSALHATLATVSTLLAGWTTYPRGAWDRPGGGRLPDSVLEAAPAAAAAATDVSCRSLPNIEDLAAEAARRALSESQTCPPFAPTVCRQDGGSYGSYLGVGGAVITAGAAGAYSGSRYQAGCSPAEPVVIVSPTVEPARAPLPVKESTPREEPLTVERPAARHRKKLPSEPRDRLIFD